MKRQNLTRRKQNARFVFVGVITLAAMSVGWPIYPLFASRPEPFVLGIPFSFAWIILWMIVVFAVLCWLYRVDHAERDHSSTRIPES